MIEDVRHRPTPLPQRFKEEKWFSKAPIHSELPPSLRPPPPPIGRPGSAILLGAISGSLGGVMMLFSAQLFAFTAHRHVDFVSMATGVSERLLHVTGVPQAGLVLAAVLGGLLGALFGYLARRLVRVPARLVFFGALTPLLWTFTQGFVIGHLAPDLARALPFFPLAGGAFVFGICIAVVPPPSERWVR